MDTMLILGDGALGRAVEAAALKRAPAGARRPARIRVLGPPARRPARPAPSSPAPSLIVEASRGDAVAANLAAGLEAGCRRLRHRDDRLGRRSAVASRRCSTSHGAAAVAASNFSLGVVLFGRLVEAAVELFGPLDAFDPYLVEWHRRSKRDRPSGTATDLARRIVADHPRLATADDLEVVSVRAGDVAGHAPGRLRCRRRDDRAAPDGARSLGLRRRHPRRRRLAGPRPTRARPPRLRPHRRRAHRSRPHRSLKGDPR